MQNYNVLVSQFLQGFGGPTIIVENPPPSDYLTNGHHQWPIGATAIEGYDPSMMANDVRECVSIYKISEKGLNCESYFVSY